MLLKSQSLFLLCIFILCVPNSAQTSASALDLGDIHTTALVSTTIDTISTITTTLASAVWPENPTGIISNMLFGMIQDGKFFEIAYSPRLQILFLSHNATSRYFGININMNEALVSSFNYSPLPIRFQLYGLHSVFLVNFWGASILLGSVFASLAILKLFERVATRSKGPANNTLIIVKKLRYRVQNFSIIQLYKNLGDILFLFILQAGVANFDLLSDLLSLLIALIFIVLGLIYLTMHVIVLVKYQRIKKKKNSLPSELEAFTREQEGFKIFFYSFKDTSLCRQLYLFFIVLRSIMSNIFAATLYSSPLAQCVISLCFTLAVLGYLIIGRPFKLWFDWAQQFICELIFLIANICFLVMAIMDLKSTDIDDTKVGLGEAVIFSGIIFNFVPPIFIAVKIFIIASGIIKGKPVVNNRAPVAPVYFSPTRVLRNKQAVTFAEPEKEELPRVYKNKQTIPMEHLYYSGSDGTLLPPNYLGDLLPRHNTSNPTRSSITQSYQENSVQRPSSLSPTRRVSFAEPELLLRIGNQLHEVPLEALSPLKAKSASMHERERIPEIREEPELLLRIGDQLHELPLQDLRPLKRRAAPVREEDGELVSPTLLIKKHGSFYTLQRKPYVEPGYTQTLEYEDFIRQKGASLDYSTKGVSNKNVETARADRSFSNLLDVSTEPLQRIPLSAERKPVPRGMERSFRTEWVWGEKNYYGEN